MADTKISALTSGNPAQSGDEIPIARSGANYKITAGSIASLSSTPPGGSNTQVQFNNSGAFGGSANLTWDGTNVQIGATGALRLADTDSSNYVAFKSPGTVASNVTWTLPSADGTSNQVLTTNGSGTLSWSTPSGSGDVVGPASAVDSQIALFNSTTGKLIKAATTTGLLKASSGVIAAAVSSTDYAPATTGTNAQLLANSGSGGFANVTVGSNLALSAGTLTAGLVWQSVQTTGFTAVAGRAYPCNTTSAAFTVTLPASATAGDQITLTDYAGTFGTNNLTVNPNSLKIEGDTANKIITTSGNSVNLVYIDSTRGWLVYSAVTATPFVPSASSVEFLVLAGGGGGGTGNGGGGGGAGGLRYGTAMAVTAGTSYSITVGSSGAGGSIGTAGTDGGNSVFNTVTSNGGGGGGSANSNGRNGGSGGGGGGSGVASTNGGTATSITPITGETSTTQGKNGGNNFAQAGVGPGGGGGGASAAGSNAASSTGGNGGNGTANSISGSSVTYAGGGGGASISGTQGTGGSGGGGNAVASGTGGAGTANLGGGGGGSAGTTGGAGGSGTVIIRYLSTYAPATTTGSPTVSVSGGYRTYTFTGNGSITF